MENNVLELSFMFCAVIVLYLVGMADDLIGARYRAKFVIQILSGFMMIAGGLWINNLHGLLGICLTRLDRISDYHCTEQLDACCNSICI